MNESASAPPEEILANGQAEHLVHAILQLAHGLEGRLEEALQGVGLSGAKYWLLKRLAGSSAPLALSELAARQKCAPSNITQLVDRLEADGLVRRIDDPADRRSKRAELTARGRELQMAGAREVERVQGAFVDALPAGAREALARGLGASG